MSNLEVIKGLKPENLWKHFSNICDIPHGSKNEEAICEYLIKFAKQNNLEVQKDEVGNILIRKNGTNKDSETIVLQAHVDMVCEKNASTTFDFKKDGIKLRKDGIYLKACGTTLGADNGIGVAAMLAIAEDKSLKHKPLEFIFTIDEETGLTGANGLKPNFLKGKTLINLDTEEEGEIYIGCAGGADTTIELPLKYIPVPKNHTGLKIKIHGGSGGHSGVNIHENRINTNEALTFFLGRIFEQFNVKLAGISGGDKRNAIPRESFATIAIDSGKLDKLNALLDEFRTAMTSKHEKTDPNLKMEIEKVEIKDILDEETNRKAICLISALPHGVLAMSREVAGLVETSTNFGVVSTESKTLRAIMSSRSSVSSSLKFIRSKIKAIGILADANILESDGYPGWKPNTDSKILKFAESKYEELFGKKPLIKAVHAGLECGIIGEKFPGMDMISIGPSIFNPHCPDESVEFATVEKFYNYLLELIK